MKNKIFIIAITAISFFSCESNLELVNPDSTTIDKAFETEVGANASLAGVYSRAQLEFNMNGIPQLLGDWQSDNVGFRGSFPTYQEIRDYTTLTDNGSVFSIWDGHYEMIGQANIVIARTNACPDPLFTQVEKDNNVGEAKFMRALSYLQLLNLFSQPVQVAGVNAPGVPLVLGLPTDIGRSGLPRATIGQVYTQIEADLNDAVLKITNTNRTKATALAAKALLARVYLYQSKYPEAADFANQAIGSADVALAINYDFYNKPDDKENIFTLVNLANDAQNGGTSFSRMCNPVNTFNGRGDCPFSPDFLTVSAAEAGDLRNALKFADPGLATRFFTTKFINNPSDFAADAPIVRITEMYLTRAEANLLNSSAIGDTPLNDINRLRTRAGLAGLGSVNLNAILLERRKELCFEGFRRMDLLRNNLPLRRVGLAQNALSVPGAVRNILPIPQREVDLSIGKVLKQNTGY